MKIRILARTIVYNRYNNKILLVKNKGTKFWYVPGGGWEYDHENILECARREVQEETGLHVKIKKLLYVQEFHESIETIFFETLWLAEPTHKQELNKNHIDVDRNGGIEKAQWFNKDEIQRLKVFPDRLKNKFWDNINYLLDSEDPFIGVI